MRPHLSGKIRRSRAPRQDPQAHTLRDQQQPVGAERRSHPTRYLPGHVSGEGALQQGVSVSD